MQFDTYAEREAPGIPDLPKATSEAAHRALL